MTDEPLWTIVADVLAGRGPHGGPTLLQPDERLVVGVSGGPDSLSLLHMLAKGVLHPRDLIEVGHLDHRWRPDSAAEAATVESVAGGWGLSVHVGTVDVAAVARQQGLSLEEAGRQERYRFLARVADESGAQVVATAHHRDDVVETVLLHLLRGAGLTGLRGMARSAAVPDAASLRLIRPLLDLSRAEIEAYCARHDLHPLRDPTNLEPTFLRNRLRLELLPELERLNPGFRRRLWQLSRMAAAELDVLAADTDRAWSLVRVDGGPGWVALDREEWGRLPLATRRRVLRRAVATLRPGLRDVGFGATELARSVADAGQAGREAHLPGGAVLRVEYEQLHIAVPDADQPAPRQPQLASTAAQVLPVPGQLELANGWSLDARILHQMPRERITGNPDPWVAYSGLVADTLIVRPRRRGERFQPLGMGGQSAKVSDVMINRRIDAHLRRRWPIVATSDHLLWLVGHQLDERARVMAQDQTVLRLTVRPPSGADL
ncbi:MAG: tRNA lysidine(34) synthetase TilS [Candidatus Promineifilaceae bacterium]|nr:tRNA lysidine(34) synthetase TilS [Candidatus Promineifilaceae bacterium]